MENKKSELSEKKESFQLYKSDLVIVDLVETNNKKGFYTYEIDVAEELKKVKWHGNMRKKLDHLVRHKILENGPMVRRSEYERDPEKFDVKLTFSRGFKKSYQLGKNYLEEKYNMNIVNYG